jgi:hypothetical protein
MIRGACPFRSWRYHGVGLVESKIDFEQLLAEGRVIEIAEQMRSNAGRIDSLEEDSSGTHRSSAC